MCDYDGKSGEVLVHKTVLELHSKMVFQDSPKQLETGLVLNCKKQLKET